MAKFNSTWLVGKQQFRSLTGVDAETFHKMVEQLRPHWRERIVVPKNRPGRPWGVGQLEDHLLVLLILYRCSITQDFMGWGRLYTSKLPVTAVHVMNNDVIPTFEDKNARITTVLSDNDREFCGRPDRHPYELFLQLEEIEHRTTKVRRPQSNGYVERMHRTLLDEHFRVMGRKKFYESVDEMQIDLNAYLII